MSWMRLVARFCSSVRSERQTSCTNLKKEKRVANTSFCSSSIINERWLMDGTRWRLLTVITTSTYASTCIKDCKYVYTCKVCGTVEYFWPLALWMHAYKASVSGYVSQKGLWHFPRKEILRNIKHFCFCKVQN